MTFTSFAQNLEDVLLNRVFSAIDDGAYIDVGAADPEVNSVTKAFYDRGWSGINIEPSEYFFERLIDQRERDVNLSVVATAKSGDVMFYDVEGHEELSTTSKEVAASYKADGRAVLERRVPARTLADICAEHAPPEVHFLKIDVEGGELDVIRGADFKRFRPWVVVVEALTFGRDLAEVPKWDDLLTKAGYTYVYYDGLNRFYLSAEHDDLAAHFTQPVNVKDDYVRPTEGRARLMIERIGNALGLQTFSDEHEVLERVQRLLEDRIQFELQATGLQESLTLVQDENRILDDTVTAGRIELESYWQSSFERERHIAWLRSEIERSKVAVAEANLASDLLREQLVGFHRTVSWRVSLPLRVIRRPDRYFKKLTGR